MVWGGGLGGPCGGGVKILAVPSSNAVSGNSNNNMNACRGIHLEMRTEPLTIPTSRQ